MVEQDADEFGIPIKKKVSVQTDEFGIPIKKKVGTTSISPDRGQQKMPVDLQGGSKKSLNGSDSSPGFRPVTDFKKTKRVVPQTMKVEGIKKQKNSWKNIGVFTPQTVIGGLEKDAGSAIQFIAPHIFSRPDQIFAKDHLTNIGKKLEGWGEEHERIAQQNQLPQTIGGGVASSAIGFVPDLLEMAITPEVDIAKFGKLGDLIAKYGGKYAPKAVKLATGKFPIQQGTKGLVNAFSEGKKQGLSDKDATKHALVQGVKDYGKGILFEGAGEAAGKLSNFGKKFLEKSDLLAEGTIGKIQKKILHSTAQAAAFSAVPFITNAIQGNTTSLDEIKNNAVFGGVMGLFHGEGGKEKSEPTAADGSSKEILERSPLIDMHNFMSADIDAIKLANESSTTPIDYQIKSANHVENAFKSDNEEEKQQEVVQSSINGKLSSVKAVTKAILQDKKGVIDGVDELPLNPDVKQSIIDKINRVHKELDPIEQKKTEIGRKISEKDIEITKLSEKSDDPIKNAENEVGLDNAKKEKDELNNELKNLILKQKEDEKINESKNERSSGQPATTSEESQATRAIGEDERSIQQKGENDEGRKELKEPVTGEVKTEPVYNEAKPKNVISDELKRKDYQSEMMSPSDYLEQSDEIAKGKPIEKDIVNSLKESILKGDPIDPVSLTYDKEGNIIDQNGRHRAQAAIDLGIKEIPVVKIKGGLKDAIKEKQVEESGGREHKKGDAGGETTKAGSSDRPIRTEEGETEGTKKKISSKLSLSRYEKTLPENKTTADKIRKLKYKAGIEGVDTNIYDDALKKSASEIEQGGTIDDAIQSALDHIKSNYKDIDENNIKKSISIDLSSAGIENRYDDPQLIEANNAYVDAKIKGKFGVNALDDIIDKLQDTDLKSIVDKVKKDIQSDSDYLEKTRKKVLDNSGGSEKDQASLLMDQYDLRAKEESLVEDINQSTNDKKIQELQNKLSKIQSDILDNALANRLIGREASSIFRLRQIAVDQNANIDYMRERYKASLGTKKLNAEQEEEVRKAYQKIRESEIEVKRLQQEEQQTKKENERLQQENDSLKKIIEDAKKKHLKTSKGSSEKLTSIRKSIDDSKNELNKIFSARASSLGILNPEAYKHIKNIITKKAEEIYVKTKSSIELNHLIKSVMDEIKDIAPDLKEQDIRDALTGNYKSEKRVTKTELQNNISELKRQARIIQKYQDYIDNDKEPPGISKEDKEFLDKERKSRKEDLEGLDIKSWNVNRYKQTILRTKELQGKIDRGEFTTISKEAKKFEKSEKLKKAEHELALRKYLWDKKNNQELLKNKPWYEKLANNILQWQRFAVLSYPTTAVKLGAVAAKGLIVKPFQLAFQQLAHQLTPKKIGGIVYGKVRPESVSKFYSAFIRNFSIENLKNAFKGLDKADILYGKSKYMEDYDVGSGFYNDLLQAPGRSHGYIKSFLLKPETAFAHEQLMQGYMEMSQEIEKKLKDTNLSENDRSILEEQRKLYDLSNDETLERVNTLASEHGKWAIMMQKNNAVEKIRTLFNSLQAEKQPSLATKASGFLLKTEFPILKLPVNYARRYFLYKYGLIKAISGGGEMPGLVHIALKGADKLTDYNKELLSRSLTYGSMGAASFVAGYLLYNNIEKQDDGSVKIKGKHIPKILLDSPLDDSFLSGSEFGERINTSQGNKSAMDWISNFAKSDIDVAKKMPFTSQLNYGFMTKFSQALFYKQEERAGKALDKAADKKIKDIIEPGVLQELTQYIDPNVKERKPRNLIETLKTGVPGLSKQVPR